MCAKSLIQFRFTSLSSEKAVKDVSIEEAGIDDIIKIAYGK
jgi:hypothetical protein